MQVIVASIAWNEISSQMRAVKNFLTSFFFCSHRQSYQASTLRRLFTDDPDGTFQMINTPQLSSLFLSYVLRQVFPFESISLSFGQFSDCSEPTNVACIMSCWATWKESSVFLPPWPTWWITKLQVNSLIKQFQQKQKPLGQHFLGQLPFFSLTCNTKGRREGGMWEWIFQ